MIIFLIERLSNILWKLIIGSRYVHSLFGQSAAQAALFNQAIISVTGKQKLSLQKVLFSRVKIREWAFCKLFSLWPITLPQDFLPRFEIVPFYLKLPIEEAWYTYLMIVSLARTSKGVSGVIALHFSLMSLIHQREIDRNRNSLAFSYNLSHEGLRQTYMYECPDVPMAEIMLPEYRWIPEAATWWIRVFITQRGDRLYTYASQMGSVRDWNPDEISDGRHSPLCIISESPLSHILLYKKKLV